MTTEVVTASEMMTATSGMEVAAAVTTEVMAAAEVTTAAMASATMTATARERIGADQHARRQGRSRSESKHYLA